MSLELGSNFSAKLEPFMLMSKSAKGAAAAKLIQDATSAPGVFVFAELLELPNIQELAQHEKHGPHFSLLQLFSYRTFQDYLEHKDILPPLNLAQITKLKHLSLVTLASERRILPYSYLLQSLQMPTIRDLEDLIIDAIYLDILHGKLDQKEQQLEVEYTMGRDLEPGKLENVLAALQDWASTTASVLATLDNKISSISSESVANKAQLEEHEKLYTSNLKEILEKAKDGRSGSASTGRKVLGVSNNLGADDRMDVDEPNESIKGKNRKAPQEPAAKQQRKRNRF